MLLHLNGVTGKLELGIYKLSYDKICILPIADNRETWKGNEYLKYIQELKKVNIQKITLR